MNGRHFFKLLCAYLFKWGLLIFVIFSWVLQIYGFVQNFTDDHWVFDLFYCFNIKVEFADFFFDPVDLCRSELKERNLKEMLALKLFEFFQVRMYWIFLKDINFIREDAYLEFYSLSHFIDMFLNSIWRKYLLLLNGFNDVFKIIICDFCLSLKFNFIVLFIGLKIGDNFSVFFDVLFS